MSLCILALVACFSTTTTEGSDPDLSDEPPDGWIGDGDDGGAGDGGSSSGDGGSSSGDGGSSSGSDGDGDGWSSSSDCDDSDPDVNPGVDEDQCDGVDSDCDGLTDEDYVGDAYEDNDQEDGGTTLGDLTDDDATVRAYLNPEDDVDGFYFYVEDSNWDWFGIVIDVTVPDGVDMVAELWFNPDSGGDWDLVLTADDGGLGRDEIIDYGGGYGGDDSGWYGLLLYSDDGSTCEEQYVVDIEA